MSLLWIAPLLFVAFWLFSLPIFTPPGSLWPWMLGGGIALNLLGMRRAAAEGMSVRYFLLALPLLIFFFLVPFPFNVGALVLAGALGLTALSFVHRKIFSPLASGLLLSGVQLSVQAAVLPLYYLLAPRYHDASFLSPLVSRILEAVGRSSSFSNGIIYLRTMTEVLEVHTTWEKLGAFSLLLFLVGGGALLFLSKGKRLNAFLILVASVAGYALVRYVFLVSVFAEIKRPHIFWLPWITILTFLPMSLILVRFIRLKVTPYSLEWGPFRAAHASLVVGTGLAAFCLVGFFSFHDPGEKKAGRILVDEGHSDWEWTTREYDTNWYGPQSGYNYYCFADWLDHYYDVESTLDSITPALLESVDVLIVKVPTRPFEGEEIAAIEEFVRAGGGLFLIGDHTNVFGSTTYLNPIASRFGLRFNYDSTYDLNRLSFTRYEPPPLLPHPVLRDLRWFLFATSCTATGSLMAEDVMVGSCLRALDLDYSRASFFPDKEKTTNFRFGLFFQTIGRAFGRGRVLIFTDSTVFSNFYMFLAGRPEYALGAMRWLNRTNRFVHARSFFLIAGLSALVATVLLFRSHNGPTSIFFVLFSAFLTVSLAIFLFQRLDARSYRLQEPHTPFTRICFEEEHSYLKMPLYGVDIRPSRSPNTFFIWTQRLGYVPSMEPTLEECIAKGDIVVLINPFREFSTDELDAVATYLETGGKLLILDDYRNRKFSTTNQLLTQFGMEVVYRNVGSVLFDSNGLEIGDLDGWAEIRGGTPLLSDEEGKSCFSVREHGEGILAVWTSSFSFTDEKLGKHNTVPNEQQRILYELEFWILEAIRTKEFVPFEQGRYVALAHEEVIERTGRDEIPQLNEGRKR